jgi:nicotinamidase-related amidase
VADLITLRAASGLTADPPALSASTLIMIDCQNTYTRGPLELDGVQPALDQAEELLDRARTAGIPVIHIQHDAGPGSPYETHMCVNSTARGAFSLGYAPTVVAGATATRNLPGTDGGVVHAAALQAASLASIADLFGVVVADVQAVPD